MSVYREGCTINSRDEMSSGEEGQEHSSVSSISAMPLLVFGELLPTEW